MTTDVFSSELLEYIDAEIQKATIALYQANADKMISQSLEFQDLYKMAVTTQRTANRTENVVDKMQLELDTVVGQLNVTRFFVALQGVFITLILVLTIVF